jgi:hypothetical protein
MGQACWPKPVIPVLRRLRQRVTSQSGLQNETVSKIKERKERK